MPANRPLVNCGLRVHSLGILTSHQSSGQQQGEMSAAPTLGTKFKGAPKSAMKISNILM